MLATANDRDDLARTLMGRYRPKLLFRAAQVVEVNPDCIIIEIGGSRYRMKIPEYMVEPSPGDYYILHDDGYTSISPKNVFEMQYVPM